VKLLSKILLAGLLVAVFLIWKLGRAPKPLRVPKVSDHYSNGMFFNPWKIETEQPKTFLSILKWRIFEHREAWPDKLPEDFVVFQKPNADRKNFVQFINHASVLIDADGTRFLCDPNFAKRASPVSLLGPARHHPTPFALEDIARLNFVLVSHNHYDHMSLETLKKLDVLYSPKFIVPESNAAYLVEAGINPEHIIELDWWESTVIGNSTITLAPSQHWSKRRLYDRDNALWGSFIIESLVAGNPKRIYFAGDTGFGPHFEMIHKRWGNFDLSLLPVGAYEPRWFMKFGHMNPEEAVKAHQIIASKKTIGIHHGCFQLTDEGFNDPEIALKASLEKEKLDPTSFLYPKPGEIINL
jgi:L-ascorbate metabolism protein UlaG (beta-lactamase superfamily)